MSPKLKEPVILRRRMLKNGSISLYLAIYQNGVRSYEYLKLYLIPEKDKRSKELNKETLALANSLKAAKILEVQNQRFGYDMPKPERVLFFDYAKSVAETKSGHTKTAYLHAINYMKLYECKNITFMNVTRQWLEGFRNYLDKTAYRWDITTNKNAKEDSEGKITNKRLSANTKALYFQKVVAILSQAKRDGIIQKNPLDGVKRFKIEDAQRQYLTIDELRKLVKTECRLPIIKKVFLFSCFTGLRWSDVAKLKWSEVEAFNGKTRLVFKQQKTGGLEYLDLSNQAASLLGTHGNGNNSVFPLNCTQQFTRKVIMAWVKAAGINKHITFHCARHTFAVMMLDLGVDIYTVSKLLGHKSIETTQIYAKVLDKNKQAAVEKIPDILGG